MGLLSFLGGAVGNLVGGPLVGRAIGGALGKAADESLDRKRQRNQARSDNAASEAAERKRLVEQRQYDRGELSRLRTDAEKAGFHPLEALRAGAGSSASGTTQPRVITQLAASGNYDKFDDILTGRDALDQKLASAELQLRQIELDQARSGRSGRLSAASPRSSGILGAPDVPDPGKTTVTNPNQVGWVAPWNNDADVGEARFGELGGLFYGLRNMFVDDGYNRTLPSIAALLKITPEQAHQKYVSLGPKAGAEAYATDARAIKTMRRQGQRGFTQEIDDRNEYFRYVEPMGPFPPSTKTRTPRLMPWSYQ